jgi:hypothetical protein
MHASVMTFTIAGRELTVYCWQEKRERPVHFNLTAASEIAGNHICKERRKVQNT